MANATNVVVKQGREQFQSVFDTIWEVRATIDADSLADGAGDNDTIAVPGVALGDIVLGISLGVDQAGMIVEGYVSAANTVTVRFQNESTTNPLNLGETTIKLVVARPSF
jgi:hypothetical protein